MRKGEDLMANSNTADNPFEDNANRPEDLEAAERLTRALAASD